MTTISTTGDYNVKASINAHLRAALAAFTRPAWLATLPPLVTNRGEAELPLPCWSLDYMLSYTRQEYMGNMADGVRGRRATGQFDVSVWVSRSNADWLRQLRTMTDMVKTAILDDPNVVIMDYAANLASPASTGYLVRLGDISEVETARDPNPDIERARLLVVYRLIQRS